MGAAPFRVLGRRRKMSGIRRFSARLAAAAALAALSVFGPQTVQAQTPVQVPTQPPPVFERRLSMTDAVQLAIEQNADLEVVRISPEIQDLSIDQARANWAPSFTTLFQGDYRNNPPNSFLSGGQDDDRDRPERPQLRVRLDSCPGSDRATRVGLGQLPVDDQQRLRQLLPTGRLDPHVQLHAAAAAQLRHRHHPPAAAGLEQEPRDLRRAGARGGGDDDPRS